MIKFLNISCRLIILALFFLCAALFFAFLRIKYLWGDVVFEQILIHAQIEGARISKNIIFSFLLFSIVPAALISALAVYAKAAKKYLLLGIFFFVGFIIYQTNLLFFYRDQNVKTDIYAKHYISPQETSFIFPQKKRNLIVLYVESLEEGYAKPEISGDNLLPELSALKRQGISFPGFHQLTGQDYTIAAMVGSHCAVPYKITPAKNMASLYHFLPGIVCYPEILRQNGYDTYFLKGADLKFTRTGLFLTSHGYNEATGFNEIILQEKGNSDLPNPTDWGYSDRFIYELAKQKLSEIAKNDSPFLFTMLTLDTHGPDTYLDKDCPVKYKNNKDVIVCADQMAADFIRWLQKQDFYRDTTVMILGDHPQTGKNSIYPQIKERQIFNLILNAVPNLPKAQKAHKNAPAAPASSDSLAPNKPISSPAASSIPNLPDNPAPAAAAVSDNFPPDNLRQWTTLDVAPTLLEAIGVTFKQGKFGLGRSLFSASPTLYELMPNRLDLELKRYAPEYDGFNAVNNIIKPRYEPFDNWGQDISTPKSIEKYASFAETAFNAVWLDTLSFTLSLPATAKGISLDLSFRVLFMENKMRQVTILANKQKLEQWTINDNLPQPLHKQIFIPASMIGPDRKLLLEFKGDGLGYTFVAAGIGLESFKIIPE